MWRRITLEANVFYQVGSLAAPWSGRPRSYEDPKMFAWGARSIVDGFGARNVNVSGIVVCRRVCRAHVKNATRIDV